MIDFTTIVGVDTAHLAELKLVWPTWKLHRPELLSRKLLLLCDASDDSAAWDQALRFVDHPDKVIKLWDLSGTSGREKMLSGLVYGAARYVETPWYLKLDTDTVATAPGPWLQPQWFDADADGKTPVFVSSPWSYSKPADVVDRLDAWADRIPELQSYPPLALHPPAGTERLVHSRIISWCFFGDTNWTRRMAALCPERLPVPSQDTYLWYCAARRGDFFRRVGMKRFGWRHLHGTRRLKAACAAALAANLSPSEAVNSGVAESGHFALPKTLCAPSGVEYPRTVPSPRPANSEADSNRGVIYLLTGAAHADRLVVSLWSLRKHYSGPVTVYTTQPESHEIGRLCAADERLRIEHRTAKQTPLRKNSTFLTKLEILPHVPYDCTLFLDADTLVVGDPSDMFELDAEQPLGVTRFSEWVTSGRVMRRRLEAWRKLRLRKQQQDWVDSLVAEAIRSHPAINTGVVSFRRGADVLNAWHDLARIGWRSFICEEIALQLLLPRYRHKLADCRFNCSPIHARATDDVRIWHFHGEKHLRRAQGRALWLPAYEECVRERVARVDEWTRTAPQLAALNAVL